MALLEGQIYRTTVEGYSSDGAGIARIEGKKPGGFPTR